MGGNDFVCFTSYKGSDDEEYYHSNKICKYLEIDHKKVETCLRKGLSVVEGDANFEITNFPDHSFDYVILSQTLQAFLNPEKVLDELLRVGKKAVITIPNFGHWKVRLNLLFKGTMPVTESLPHKWYNTPNLHMCTIKDFFNFCDEKKIKIKKVIGVNEDKTSFIKKGNLEIKNLFSKLGVFLIG